MKAFITRQKRKSSGSPEPEPAAKIGDDDEPTEFKLAMLASMHSDVAQDTLLDVLLAHEGSVSAASASLKAATASPSRRGSAVIGYQKSLMEFSKRDGTETPSKKKLKSRKGTTLHLYSPEDVAEHTPCTIIHNFLPIDTANELLKEMLSESETFEKSTFKLFDNVVTSPHTTSFYVESYDDIRQQKTEYLYNGSSLTDVRRITPQLVKVKPLVQEAVNEQIQHRIATRYPDGKKLKYQSPDPWVPNSAFCNCYDGAQQNVGWHSDQLTYLGPRAVIGSISLGVAREFRVRRVLPKDDETSSTGNADAEGQISIHLPHNSLLIMHAEMQEEWKHCVTPAPSIDPHPISGNKRINITYRDYKVNMHPRGTPKCSCGIACVLRVVQKKKENFGRYFWMCHAGNIPGKNGCSFFSWAEFDEDGKPQYGSSSVNRGEARASPK